MGYIYAFLAAVFFSAGNLSIAYLSRYYQSAEQNLIRFFCASVFMLCFTLLFRRESFKAAIKYLPLFILPVSLYFAGQFLWVKGIEILQPGFASLIEKCETILSVFMAFLFFKEERKVIRSKIFLLGVFLALSGCASIIIFRKGFGVEISKGIIYCFFVALIFAVYSITVKKLACRFGAMAMSTVIMMGITLCFSIAFVAGGKGDFHHLIPGKIPLAVAVLSGILSLAIGNLLYMKAVRVIGVSVIANIFLLCPLFVTVGSYFAFHETLALLQWCSVPILFIGCALIVHVSRTEEALPG